MAEWLPQIVIFVMSVTGAPTLPATWAIARLWSRRVIAVKRSFAMFGALFMAMRALVLAGLPTTRTRMSSAALSDRALPWTVKIAAVRLEQVAALHALGARPGADEQGDVGALERLVRVVGLGDARAAAGRRSRRAPCATPSSAPSAGVISSSWRVDRLIRPEQRTAGDAEQQAVADLAGGSGDGDADGLSGHRGGSFRAQGTLPGTLARLPKAAQGHSGQAGRATFTSANPPMSVARTSRSANRRASSIDGR